MLEEVWVEVFVKPSGEGNSRLLPHHLHRERPEEGGKWKHLHVSRAARLIIWTYALHDVSIYMYLSTSIYVYMYMYIYGVCHAQECNYHARDVSCICAQHGTLQMQNASSDLNLPRHHIACTPLNATRVCERVSFVVFATQNAHQVFEDGTCTFPSPPC